MQVEIDMVKEELGKDYDHGDAQMNSPITRTKSKQQNTKPNYDCMVKCKMK